MNNSENAKYVLENALEVWQDDVDILNNLAVANMMLNKIHEAEKYVEKVLQLEPENTIANENKNYIKAQR